MKEKNLKFDNNRYNRKLVGDFDFDNLIFENDNEEEFDKC